MQDVILWKLCVSSNVTNEISVYVVLLAVLSNKDQCINILVDIYLMVRDKIHNSDISVIN